MPRLKQEDLSGVEGPGVSPIKLKELDRLGDKYIEVRDKKAELATELNGIENKMADIMVEKGITTYRWSDQEMIVKPGKTHIKVKTVKSEGVETNSE